MTFDEVWKIPTKDILTGHANHDCKVLLNISDPEMEEGVEVE